MKYPNSGSIVVGYDYSSRFNRRHKFFGHVFSRRYEAPWVDSGGTGYLRTAADNVRLNRGRAKLLKDEEPLSTYL